jgi:translocation and assembly module TamB
MNTPPHHEQSPAPLKRVHRPRWATSLIVVLVPALLALALVAGTGWWLYGTSSGMRALVAIAGALMSPSITAHGLQGSIRSGFTAESIVIEGSGWSLRAKDVRFEPRKLQWAGRIVDLERVHAQSVIVDWVASATPATPPATPATLALPIDLRLRTASIRSLQVGARGVAPTVVTEIALSGRINGEAAVIERGEFRHGPARVTIAGRIDAQPPFALQADSKIVSTLREHDVGAQVHASGSLTEVQLEIDGDSDKTRIKARASLTPFAPVPLAQLTADVAGFDPALWFEGVPTMRLRGNTNLKPAAGKEFVLSGPFAVANELPGPIDQQRLPVRSARGTLTWAMRSLVLAVEQLEAVRGTASGSFKWSAKEGIDASARVSGIDASTIHTNLVPTSVEGSLTYRLIDATHRFAGSLRNVRGVALAADLDLALRDEILDIESARLRLAGGTADLAGRVELSDRQAVRIRGSFADLDLAQLVKGIDTRLTGKVDVDGSIKPALAGNALIELADSSILGRPLAGRATVQLAQQRFDADIDARSGSAHLSAQGGLGAGKELTFELIAPELAELLPPYAGHIEARGTVRGEYSTPALQMTAVAKGLKLPGGHAIQHIDASLTGGLAPDATLAVMAKLTGHRAPSGGLDTSIAGATLITRGTTSDHSVELNATSASQQPMRAIASGGWRDGAWRGSLVAAESGRQLELRLRTPAALVVGLQTLSFGPADFEMRGAKFTAVELRRQEARWRFAGNFDDLHPQALDAQARAPRRVVRSGAGDRMPLTMRGRWDLDLADTLSGVAIIERTDGDLYGGIDAQNPIGISGMGAALSVLDNRVTGTVYVRGKALGRLDAIIDAYVDTSGVLRLAQNRPFRIDIDSVLPDLGWIGPLIGDSVQVGGAGTIRATISGTPGDPTASGDIRAESMRLAWVEQGLRLENGKLDARLEEGVLVINELVFTGIPRVMPDDKRALEAINFETPGHLSAVGRVALRSLTGSIGVQADRLPILLRRDRWMVVSGEGGITLTTARAELYAKVQVDGAYIDFRGLRGPRTLPGDVVVVRAEQPRRAVTAPPIEVTLDVEGRLGRRFYIRGAGLEARLAGQVDVTGRPGALRATGTVRTLDGIFQGYGQRLQIERGIVTFQGPLENPALNVLAVRTGLPVEVGVAIGGTALKPLVRLHSDPAMSDVERLNWLVLGRPPGGSGDGFAQERALLTAAASALFAGQSDSASANLMRSLGIDEISLRPGQDSSSILPRETVAGTLRSTSGTTAASEFVAIGKRINDDLYLTFEQALSGAAYYVALNYQLTRRLSLIARAGSTNALDLVYSIAFD